MVLAVRAYELMIIADGDLEESDVSHLVNSTTKQVEEAGGTIASVDKWGKRRFAYEINKKTEGYYIVLEVLAEGGALDNLERNLRLADEVVRHKLIRLPDHEADRRGLTRHAGGELTVYEAALRRRVALRRATVRRVSVRRMPRVRGVIHGPQGRDHGMAGQLRVGTRTPVAADLGPELSP